MEYGSPFNVCAGRFGKRLHCEWSSTVYHVISIFIVYKCEMFWKTIYARSNFTINCHSCDSISNETILLHERYGIAHGTLAKSFSKKTQAKP